MRKLSRFHVAVALLAVASIVSLLGVSLVGGTDGVTVVKIKSTTPVQPTVWWDQNPYGLWGSGVWSSHYSSWGRSYIHIMASATGMGTDDVEIRLYGVIWNTAHSSWTYFEVWSWTLDSTYWHVDYQMMVPCKEFMFWTYGPSTAEVTLSFYLSGS